MFLPFFPSLLPSFFCFFLPSFPWYRVGFFFSLNPLPVFCEDGRTCDYCKEPSAPSTHTSGVHLWECGGLCNKPFWALICTSVFLQNTFRIPVKIKVATKVNDFVNPLKADRTGHQHVAFSWQSSSAEEPTGRALVPLEPCLTCIFFALELQDQAWAIFFLSPSWNSDFHRSKCFSRSVL